MSEVLSHLGLTATNKRTLRPGTEYDKYFPAPDGKDVVLLPDGTPEQTVELIVKIVEKTKSDTAKIASILQGATLTETCRNIWNFIYNHIQYKLDKPGEEQLRRPARLWAERQTGGDCDCYSLFISSILTNLNITHYFRITKYNGKSYFQHIYVIVPNSKTVIVIDPVLEQFNKEKQFSGNKDFNAMNGIPVHFLSGVDNGRTVLGDNLIDVLDATALEGLGANETNPAAIKQYLIQTRAAIKENPAIISTVDYAPALLEMLDYAIKHWDNPAEREIALENLKRNEDAFNKAFGFAGGDDYDLELDNTETIISDYELNGLFKKKTAAEKAAKEKKKADKKGAKQEKKDAKKAAPKKKGFFKKIGESLKKGGNAFIRYNPVTIAARNGFLLFLKLNIKQAASRLKWAYATPQQAAAKGVTTDKQNKAKTALAKIEKLYADKLQGKRDKLKDAILKGKAGGLNGIDDDYLNDFSGLGVIETAIAAAAPIITAAVKIMKDSGLFTGNEGDVSEQELNNLSTATDPNPDVNDNDDGSGNDGSGDGESFFTKVGTWIKDNPLPSIGIGVALAAGAYLAFKPKKQSAQIQKNAFSGVKKEVKKLPAKAAKSSKAKKITKIHLK